jgi:hypothetical protein
MLKEISGWKRNKDSAEASATVLHEDAFGGA